MRRTVRKPARLSKFDVELMMKNAYGPEPVSTDEYDTHFGVYNWYNYMVTDKQKKSWFIKSLSKKEAKDFADIPEAYFSGVGASTRMRDRGFKFTEKQNESYRRRIEEIRKIVVKKDDRIRVMVDHSRVHIDLLDKHIDEFIENDYQSKFDFGAYVKESNLSAPIKKQIEAYYVPQFNEIVEALGGKDEQLNESYNHMGKRQLTRYRNILEDIVNMTRVAAPRKQRIVRKRERPADKQVANLNYLKKDEDTGLKSIHPEKIIGANILWIWNPKAKKLGLYKSRTGIMVAGTTLKNYDDKDAFQKHIRKPKEWFAKFKGTQTAKERMWKELNGKEFVITGRINKDTVLLGV